jgi:hypothetical protein
MPLALPCRYGRLRLNSNRFLVEPIDPEGTAVPPDTRSDGLLVTNLANYVQPVIRHQLGDSVVISPGMCMWSRPRSRGSTLCATASARSAGHGRGGLRDLRSRLFRWRVGIRWYALALLTAPLLETAILAAFSLTSQAFLPAIITAEDMASLLVAVSCWGCTVPSWRRSAGRGSLLPNSGSGMECWRPDSSLACRGACCTCRSTRSSPVGLSRRRLTWPRSFSGCWPTGCSWCGSTRSVLMAMPMHLMLTFWPFISGSPARVGVPDLIFHLVLGATAWVIRGRGGGGRPQKALARGTHACHSTPGCIRSRTRTRTPYKESGARPLRSGGLAQTNGALMILGQGLSAFCSSPLRRPRCDTAAAGSQTGPSPLCHPNQWPATPVSLPRRSSPRSML